MPAEVPVLTFTLSLLRHAQSFLRGLSASSLARGDFSGLGDKALCLITQT